MKTSDQPDIHGAPPELGGRSCDQLICEQYWYRGHLEAPANVAYLRVGSEWHRLTIDCGVVFWRTQTEGPQPYLLADLEAEARLDDLGTRIGVAGQIFASISLGAIPGGARVELRFLNGQTVIFENVDDHTSVHCELVSP